MSHSIASTRQRLFDHLADGASELAATYLKASGRSPDTVARSVEGRVRVLLTNAQVDIVRERLLDDDGTRPNVYNQLNRWFIDESSTLRSETDASGRGVWVAASAAAVVYRYLYSHQDYSADTRGRASTNGFTEFGFTGTNGPTTLLLVATADAAPFNAWLDDPAGPPPFHVPSQEEMEDAPVAHGSVLLPNQRSQLLAWLHAGNGIPGAEIDAQLAAFHERFPLSRWRRLAGRELLMEMHGRDSNDSLVYWLEFKGDASFVTRSFGSISGGSAYKFGLFWSASEQEWRSGSSNRPLTLSESEAIELATRQRDELVAAVDCVADMPWPAGLSDYEVLQRKIEGVAPQHHHLAFFHKFVYLYMPTRLDDYHSLRVQRHVTTQLGLSLCTVDGLFAGAGPLVLAYRELRESLPDLHMRNVSAAMNAVVGSPVDHWRVGTGGNGEHWPAFRDHDMVAVGWEGLGDLSDIVGGATGHAAIRALRDALVRLDPDRHKGQITKDARQLWAFYARMKEGDRVYAAYGQTIYGVGEIAGPYRYESDGVAWASRRPVRWLTCEPFKSPVKTGLRTTVYSLTDTPEIQVAASRHLDTAGLVAPQPSQPQPRAQLVLGPVGQQLERKGQVVLYGPPGTGKTYHALKVAESLVANARGKTWAELTPQDRAAVKGEGTREQQRIWVCSFHPAYGYEDFVEGLKPEATDSGALSFVTKPGVFRRICERAAQRPEERFVLIIDEFNRGDAPRIFGELLTLLELDKRERVRVELPLSGDRFTVPRNVRILATMNTADRSISLLDAAMRRRFAFVEYMPDAAVLDDMTIDGLSLPSLLELLNERILCVLGEAARNLQVGHAYLMAEARPIASVRALRNAIRYDVYPLLEEYCSESPTALAELLGEGLYDAEATRFRDELMATGREADFVEALMAWDPQRLGSASADELIVEDDV